ncbi:nuclear nucleic acid-binding protein C1D [Megalopta genalis]|uniref:nuclear nucleic acid-binding protein C1D n=1 Tax=Megalopta genalis TaxID=115081 RepID=UPI001442ED62|nr:nuclear nucleic acid-binding protein C1D-like [Megalopta genalis]
MDLDFGELSHDTELIAKVKQFREATFKLEDMINVVTNSETYEKLSNSDKIKYNLLMSYSLNSMFWMYLRAEGIDPAKHKIKSENDRLKKAMMRAKQIEERNTLMPRINKDVAQRFVRNGLFDVKNNKRKFNQIEENDGSNSSKT